MHILIAGGTGFIGRHLIPALIAQKHCITVIGRDKNKIKTVIPDKVQTLKWDELETLSPNNVDAVINLTGKGIGDSRWSKHAKQEIVESRVTATQKLASWCAKAQKKPHLYNASAIGTYGLQALSNKLPHRLTETSHVGDGSDFVSEVGLKWEKALAPAMQAHVPVTILRFGVVIKRNEGALKKIQPSFYFGLGGKLGSGKQPFCWVHVDDVVAAISFLIQHPEMTGVFNITAPECVMQEQFAKTLAASMHRPCLLKTPGFVMKAIFGQMAEELLLQGQNVYPQRLLDSGYQFKFPTLEDALNQEFNTR